MRSNRKPQRQQAQHRKYRKSENDAYWAVRYPKNWSSKISPACKESTDYICSWCWTKEAKESHHARYQILMIKPRCWGIGIFEFPLCYGCHDHVHDKFIQGSRYWIKDKRDPRWGNRNTFEGWIKLLVRYWLLRLILLIRGKSYE